MKNTRASSQEILIAVIEGNSKTLSHRAFPCEPKFISGTSRIFRKSPTIHKMTGNKPA